MSDTPAPGEPLHCPFCGSALQFGPEEGGQKTLACPACKVPVRFSEKKTVARKYVYNGQEFETVESLKAHIRETLPAEAAQKVLDMFDSALPSGGPQLSVTKKASFSMRLPGPGQEQAALRWMWLGFGLGALTTALLFYLRHR